MRKCVISVVLAALLLVAGCSGGGNNPPPKEPETPASDFEYSYDAGVGGVVITKYIGSSIKVRIPEKIEGEPVVWIEGGFSNSGIMDVYIPNSVTIIGENAFYGCTGLTNITIPDGVTSIGYRAFSDCTGLTSVIIPDGVTSIGSQAFRGCTGLVSIVLPDEFTNIGSRAFDDTAWFANQPDGVVYMGKSAIGHKGEISIAIRDGTTNISDGALSARDTNYNPWAPSITIPASVTRIGTMAFFGCSLKSVTIPDNVTEIGGRAFGGCFSSFTAVYKGKTYLAVEAFGGYDLPQDFYDAVNGQ
ncbi:MAG: leucine-rich repeat domain-containing protein [Oscillospiraceae bacterium]|nr:leucine-rich repeat domain-containing protein [Oscillospiraceae bacterium]